MGRPDWTKITENGKPFDYVDPAVTPIKEENEELKNKVEVLEKENKQLRKLIEDK